MVINRNISDLHNNLGDSAMTDYVDLDPSQDKALSEPLTSDMRKLKTEIIPEKVRKFSKESNLYIGQKMFDYFWVNWFLKNAIISNEIFIHQCETKSENNLRVNELLNMVF